jgi:predicted RNA-binding Zn ribbon-like protein
MSGVPGQLIEPAEIRWVCVDFANTVEWRGGSSPIERMPDYDHFLRWGVKSTALSPTVAESLRREAETHPRQAEAAFTDAIALREAIYRVLFAVANNLPRRPEDVELLNRWYQQAMSHKGLADAGDYFLWTWEGEGRSLHALTWRIAQSAGNLLTSRFAGRIKSCPGESCAWLFVDTSRNGSRRWCEMQICGNRAKVRRHRAGGSVKRKT